jgi:hypothetical protein
MEQGGCGGVGTIENMAEAVVAEDEEGDSLR